MIPLFISEYTIPSLLGIAVYPTSANTNVIMGAIINNPVFDDVGRIVSFLNSFNPSAKGVSNP